MKLQMVGDPTLRNSIVNCKIRTLMTITKTIEQRFIEMKESLIHICRELDMHVSTEQIIQAIKSSIFLHVREYCGP